MNERIKELRKELGLSQEAFGKRLGVSKAAISRIESGLNSISNMNIVSICREFSVNEDWLRTGSGSMFAELSRAELAAKIVGNALGSNDEFVINTFIALGQLTPAEWDVIKKFVKKIKGS